MAGMLRAIVQMMCPGKKATPLSELVCICTSVFACYFLLAWAQDERPYQLICAAFAAFLATLARYDGWALCVVMVLLVGVISWRRGYPWAQLRGNDTSPYGAERGAHSNWAKNGVIRDVFWEWIADSMPEESKW